MNCCVRCRKETSATIVSMFNFDVICMECKDRERAHPKYAEAVQAEAASLRAGTTNFAGIGKPEDL